MSNLGNASGSTPEEAILKAVKAVLTSVIRDTAVGPGEEHPLSEETRDAVKYCFILISKREQELAQLAGRSSSARPHFTDEAPEVLIPISTLKTDRQ